MRRVSAKSQAQATVPWYLIYLGIAVGGLVALVLKWLNISPVTGLSSLILAIVLSSTFLGVSLIYWRVSIRRYVESNDRAK